MSDDPLITPEDALQVAQRALGKVNDLEDSHEEIREECDDIAEDLAALQLRLSEIDEERSYDNLTLDEKIGMVREHAFEKAANGQGRASLDYEDIMWEVFDGEPGNNHCYKLMRLAAGEDKRDQKSMDDGALGFAVRDPARGSRHLAVDADLAKRGAAFYSRNKATRGEEVTE